MRKVHFLLICNEFPVRFFPEQGKRFPRTKRRSKFLIKIDLNTHIFFIPKQSGHLTYSETPHADYIRADWVLRVFPFDMRWERKGGLFSNLGDVPYDMFQYRISIWYEMPLRGGGRSPGSKDG
jgi:hypothetical protein